MKKNFLLLTLACLMGIGSAWGREISPKFVSYDGQTSGFKSTNFGGSDEKANYVQNLFDGKTCTRWCSTSNYEIYYKDKPVVMDAGNDVLLVAYHIYNAANTADWQNRRWTSWSFYGSNQTDTTSSNWTLMHDTTGVEMSTANNAKHTFIIPEENRQRFRYYKLVVHCSVDTVQQQASEFRLETDVLDTQIEAVVYQDGNKNGYTKIYDPAKMAGSDTVLSTSGRTSCDWVQLWENGPRWATFNVGATISDYGVLTEGAEPVKYNNYAEVAKYYNTANAGGFYAWNTPTKDGRKEEWYGYYELDTVDVATTLWGSNWKTPTYDQLDSLRTYTTWSWCDANNPYVEGCTLKGYKVSGVGEYAQYSIFLPLAGYHDYHLMPNIIDVSSNGYYWSSLGDGDNKNAYYMLLGSGAPSMDKRALKDGLSVRAVLADDSVAAKETMSDLVTLTLCANDSKTANVITCLKNTSVYVTAKSIDHHHFVQWSDGNTDNPRVITLTQDTALVAQFEAEADKIPYVKADGTVDSCATYIIVEDATAQVTWNEGWYVVNDTITLSAGAVCNGAVNLILADGAVLTATGGTNAGIEVSGTGNTLTIYGQSELTGKLSASSVAEYSCGIGYSNNGDDAESIVVAANWTITADGAEVTHTTTQNITLDIAGFQVVKINIVDPSGIQSIRGNNADQPSKFIQNGQLIIIRNGQMFNAQGAVVD